MATTMDSSQVGMAAAEEVEMMLVDGANTEDDDGEEIKIDDELDDDMDDDDELTDDDDDDVVSTSGRRTPNAGLHHHHNGRHYHEPRVQQHHHHHFHYFYQYPSTQTVNNIDSPQHYTGSDSRQIPTTGVTSSMNDADSAGLVRTISNGSMFGPINANLVPNLLPNGRYPTPSHLISLSANQSINNNSNHHINNNPHVPTSGHYYGPVTPTIYENMPVQNTGEQQMNPLVQQLQSQRHLHHQQRQPHNQLLANQRANFRPKPSSPEAINCISAPASPSVSIGSPQLTIVQSSPSSSSSSSTSGSSSPILSVSTPTHSQTVISSTSSGVAPSNTINNNIHNNNNNDSPNSCVTYHSYPEQTSAQTSTSQSPNADDSKNQQQTTFQQQSPQQIQANSQQPTVQQPQQQQQTPLVSTASPVSSLPTIVLPYIFGRSYQLTSQIEASNLYLCVDTVSQQEFCCKVVNSSKYSKFLGPHMRMDGHKGINQIQKVIFEQHFTFVLFERSFGDLHSYVRNKRRLRENEAQILFQQILQIVADCHHNGIVLRDLKLRKFIFANEEKTKLKLETLEGASIFEGDNDILTDKHGCPAYVSPEILYSNSYSGMAADCWSMGVILYTMLVGRYPFHDLNPSIVFVKIRRGTYDIPETLSKQARCLIRNLIRLEPEHRLTANDALAHRWFQEKWNLNTKERIIQQHISNLHSFQHQQFLFQHSLSDLTLGPPPRAILTPSLIEGLLQLSDDQVVPTF